MVAATTAGLSVVLIDDIIILKYVSVLAVVMTFVMVKFNLLGGIHQQRKSWGVFFLALGFCFEIFLFAESYTWAAFTSLMIVGIADPAAALVGTFYKKSRYNFTGDEKSQSGSAAFFIVSVMVFYVSYYFLDSYHLTNMPIMSSGNLIFAAVIISLVLTFVEALSSLGSDNFFILLFSPILLVSLAGVDNMSMLLNFTVGIALAGIVACVSFKLKFLTADGSAATFLLAGFIFGFGGWKWSVPIMTFFILSSLLFKFRKTKNEKIELYFEKTGTRDYMQVLANGGLGGVLVIINLFWNLEINYYLYLASLAAVCADTWATEIGTMARSATYNILTFEPVEQGISGGISLKGTSGAITGAFVISLSGIFWSRISFASFFVALIFSGVIGSFVDSILGATIQQQYKCKVCGKITERHFHCNEQSEYYRGIKWINNDAVNVFAGLTGIIFIVIFKMLSLI